MSKIGRQPIEIPKGVTIDIKGQAVTVKGVKGQLQFTIPDGIVLTQDNSVLMVKRNGNSKTLRAFHGLSRALIANMVTGVEKGFKKELEIVGVGYKAQMKGSSLNMQLGFSHPVQIEIWEGLNEKKYVTAIVK